MYIYIYICIKIRLNETVTCDSWTGRLNETVNRGSALRQLAGKSCKGLAKELQEGVAEPGGSAS